MQTYYFKVTAVVGTREVRCCAEVEAHNPDIAELEFVVANSHLWDYQVGKFHITEITRKHAKTIASDLEVEVMRCCTT